MIRPPASALAALAAFLFAAVSASAQDVGGFMNSDGVSRTLYISEPSRSAGILTFGCNLGDMTVVAPAVKQFRLIIPAALGVTWDTTITPITVGGPQSGKIQSVGYFGNKTILITTTAGGLVPLDIFTLNNLRYNASAASSDSLFMDKDNDGAFSSHAFGFDDRDPAVNTLTVASNPAFSVNGGSLIFRTLDPDFVCGQINIQEQASFPAIKVGTNIRIQIPASLNMTWDTNITTVGATGAASVKIDRFNVSYPTTRIAEIPVTTSFSALDDLQITGLEFSNFGLASGPLGLQLVVNGATHASATSASTYRVAGVPTISMASQVFGLNDPDTTNNQITVTEVPVGDIPMITAANNIEIRIPAGYPMQWANDFAPSFSITGAGTGAVGAVSYTGSNKNLVIDVTTSFSAGQALTINNLTFTAFSSTAGGTVSLELDVDTDGTSEDVTGASVTIVQPTLSIANTFYNEGEDPTDAPSLLVTNSSPGRIRDVDNIRIRIPAGLNMIWDTTVTAPSLVMGGIGVGAVAANVTYPLIDNKTVQIDVTTTFAALKTLTITGLRFRNFVATGPLGLELDVASSGTTVHTTVNTILIGGAPTISSSAQSFTFNDSNLASTSVASNITVTDAGNGVPMIKMLTDIRVIIPASLTMTWDTTLTTIGSAPGGLVQNTGVTYSIDQKTAIIQVAADFTSGQSVIISGLRFANFSAGTGRLELEVDGDPLVEAVDAPANTKSIGRPNISSNANQFFNQGEESTFAENIVITDDTTIPTAFPRIRAIDATGDIRIRIPAGLNMEWDTSITTIGAVMGGVAGTGNVSSSVTYDITRKVVRIDVTADFTGGRSVTLSGLKFVAFGAFSGPASLELICSGTETTTVCRSDDKLIRIGGMPTISSAAQSFTFNDSNLATTSVASGIAITDATLVPMITTGNGIRLVIPGSLSMTWDTNQTTIGTTNGKVTTTGVTYTLDQKTAILIVNTNFVATETVTISNLRFANFTATGSGQLMLEVDGDPAVEATNATLKSIGRPNISSLSNQFFNQGEEETGSVNIVVTDDTTLPTAIPRIRMDDTTGDIRIRIPAGLDMEWDTSITTIGAVMGGVAGSGSVSTGVTYDIPRKVVRIDVTADFTGGRSVTLSGLRFWNFNSATGPASLELICSGTATTTVCRTDDKTIQIGGRVTLSSSANQSFLVGDAAANASSITVTDASGVPMISTANHIRLVIPAGLNMAWDSTVNTITSNNPNVSTSVPLANYVSAKIVRLTVLAPFAGGESVTVSGLRFTNFAAAGSSNLEVEVDGDPAAEDVDDKTIVIGAPTLASAAVQTFTKNDLPKAISQITIQESNLGAGIKDGFNIRIIIPAGLNMSWDMTDTTATFGGSAFTNGRVANPVVFLSPKIMLINVSSDFLPNESLTISGLSYTGFGNSTGTGRLTLEIDADSDADATDTQTIAIGSPTISSFANQSFNVLDPITPISQITVAEDLNTARITAAGDIRIRIPAGLDMTWDTTDLAATLVVGGPGGGAVGAVSYPPGNGNKLLLIDVTAPFSTGQTLTITNLGFDNFNTESSAASLELTVNSVDLTVCNVDDKTKQIGGQAGLASANQAFAVNDPDTAAASLLITDAPGSPKITIANGIQIKIPAGLDMTWDPGIVTITSDNPKVTQTGVTYSLDFKTAILIVNANFLASEAVNISGLEFRTFGAAGSGSLTLELDGDVAAEATDTGTKSIGAPTLLSSGSQVFLVGAPSTAASSFIITDDANAPRIRMATGLRVRIPAGLDMVWNNSIPTAGISMGGAGNGSVSTSVGYSIDAKELLLTVTQDFAGSKNVTVTGVQFRNFNSASIPAFLELDVTNAGTTTDVDGQSKAIQGSPTIASASQSFTTNDPPTASTSFVITDAGGVATITTAQDIRIKIPAGLNMIWDTSVVAVVSNNLKVAAGVTYADANKTVVLDVVGSNFTPGESVTITGLGFATFGASSTGTLTLELDGDPTAEATDPGARNVGTPTLLSSSAQVFLVGPGPAAAVSFTVTDDANRPRIRMDNATGDLRIKIPASLDMVWHNGIATATIVMGGPAGAGAVATGVTYSIDAKELVLDVTADFVAGKSVTVSGLQFRNFNSPCLPASLELEVNNANTNVGVDGLTKAIQGTPVLASGAQAFSKGDPSTSVPSVVITDAGGVAMITAAGDIRIKIPAGLNMTWDTSVMAVGSNNAKVAAALLPYEDLGKTVVLNVTSDFSPAEAVTITGLRFMNFAAAGTGFLQLELDGDPAAETADTGGKGIGAPTMASLTDQAFNVGDAATPMASITITDDLATARLRFDNATGDVRIRIPSGFNMTWDTLDTTATVSVSGGAGTVSPTVSYELGGTVLVVNVLTNFSLGQQLTISDLSFTGFGATSPLDRLELEVNNAGTTCNEDASTIIIGGLPTISSAANQTFTVNDPATPIATLTLTDASGVGTFRASRDIRVRIPAAFPMEWNQLDAIAVVTPGAGSGTAASGVTFLSAKILQIDITADFSPGQTLTISGLSFTNFMLPGSGAQLELDVDLDPAAEALDDKTLAIGAPTLSSASSQIFVVGDPATAASAMLVTDGAVARVMAAGDIRIRIPASLAMVWDTDIATATIGGSAVSKASTGVFYENGGKTLRIDVLTDFAPGETLTISGVSFESFLTASTPANLELEVNNAGTVADFDDKTKAIRGVPSISSAADQAFTVGDPPTAASLITVQDAGGVAVITTADDIRVQIPPGFGMTWNTALTAPTFGGATAKVNPVVTYTDADRTLVIDVTTDFSPADTLTISGVGFANFLAGSAPANLRLDLNADGTPDVVDPRTIAIGAPTLSSAANQVFGTLDPSTPMAVLTIADDAVTPRIKASTDLRVRIPAGFNMTWNTSVAVATLGGTAAARVSTAVTFPPGDKVAVLDVTSDFLPGETLIVSGLEFTGFPAVSAIDRLRLETNNLGTDAALDVRTIRIGSRPSIMTATTGDFNGNGSIDRIVVAFSEDVDGTSLGVTNALGFTLAGYTLAFGLETGPGIVTYFIPESGLPDTGAVPALSYDPIVGALRDADDGLEPNAYGPTAVIDGAPPRIVGFSFQDTDSNGRLDELVFTFSELMDETQEDLSDWAILDGDGTTNLLLGLTDASLVILGNTLTITLADTTGTTGLPRYRYFEDGSGGALRDRLLPLGLLLPNSTNNALPVANAGLDRTLIPTVVTLDGSGSTDVDGQALTFSWAQTGGPAVVLSGASTAAPSFSAFTAATYVFTLTVGDGLSTANDSVSISILNVPPSALAGVDQTVTAPAVVTLDGSASMDTNGDAIAFAWSQVSGTAVVLTGANTMAPTFPTTGLNEVLVFRLTVTDSALNAKTDDVVVRVNSAGNGVPTADPGAGYTAVVGATLTLDGRRSSDPEGNPLTFDWSPATLLGSPTTATPTFAPASPGIYVFTLVVRDAAAVDSAPATVRVTVLPAGSTNRPPVPVVSVVPGNAVTVGTPVTLNGADSVDPDGQAVRFAWTEVSGPVVMFPNPSAAAPSFTPVVPGTYVFQLIVDDGSLQGTPLLVPVQVLPVAAVAPLAQIVVDPLDDPETDGLVFSTDAPILLQGTSSTGTGLIFAWTQSAGPATSLSGATTSGMSFSPVASGLYRFTLLVRDVNGLTDAETIDLIVETPANAVPTSSAGPDQAAAAGATVTLDGSASADSGADADGVTTFGTGLLAFWHQVSGPAVALSSPTAPSPSFTPLTAGVYVFELVVSDGKADGFGDSVSVTVTGVVSSGGGGGSSGGGGCGLTGFEVLLLLAFRRRRHMGCDAAR